MCGDETLCPGVCFSKKGESAHQGCKEYQGELAKLPTFIMDATLPDTAILRGPYPNVEYRRERRGRAAHVKVRYVPNGQSSKKIFDSAASSRHAHDIRRYISEAVA